MEQDRQIWQVWASFLHQWGIESWVVDHLETFQPLFPVGTSLLYVAQPLLQHLATAEQLGALTRVLAEPACAQAFIHYLQEATQA